LDIKQSAVGNLARGVGASLDSISQERLVPSHDEVAVVTKPYSASAVKVNAGGGHTSSVTIRSNKLARHTGKLVCVPDSLVEERNQTLGEVRRAVASHNLRRVGDMRFIIGRSQVAIPAAGKHQLKADTVRAVSIKVRLLGQEVTEERAFGSGGIVKTVETHSSLAKEFLSVVGSNVPVRLWYVGDRVRKVALEAVACNHGETSREGGNGGLAGIGVQEVVSEACQQW
jgi:hypothetical protein